MLVIRDEDQARKIRALSHFGINAEFGNFRGNHDVLMCDVRQYPNAPDFIVAIDRNKIIIEVDLSDKLWLFNEQFVEERLHNLWQEMDEKLRGSQLDVMCIIEVVETTRIGIESMMKCNAIKGE